MSSTTRNITAETAGTSDMHIRTAAEIRAQEIEQEKKEKAETKQFIAKAKQKVKQTVNFAKNVGNKVSGISDTVSGLQDKVSEASELVKDNPKVAALLASVAIGLVGIKTSADDIKKDSEFENQNTGAAMETDASKTEKTETFSDKSSESNITSSTESSEKPKKKSPIYVPESHKMDSIARTINTSRKRGEKAKVLKYTPEQMADMPNELIGNIVSHGMAMNTAAAPVVDFVKKGVDAAQQMVKPVTKFVRNKTLPEMTKVGPGFMSSALNFNVPGFDVNNYLTSEKDTSRLYDNAFDFGEFSSEIPDIRHGDVDDTTASEHISAEDRQALRDAKYGKADAGVNYNYGKDNDYGLVMGG